MKISFLSLILLSFSLVMFTTLSMELSSEPISKSNGIVKKNIDSYNSISEKTESDSDNDSFIIEEPNSNNQGTCTELLELLSRLDSDGSVSFQKEFFPVNKLNIGAGKTVICSQGKITNDILYINLDERDMISLETFKEIIITRKPLPFVLAVVKTSQANTIYYHFFDAQTLNKNYNTAASLEFKNPANGLIVKKIYYYILDPIKDSFDYVGSDKDLWFSTNTSKKAFLANLIAADLSKPYYLLSVGLCYELGVANPKENNSDLAKIFYDAALSNTELPEVRYCLYCYYIKKNIEKAKRHLSKALSSEESKNALFKFAMQLFTRANGLYSFNEKATVRACHILMLLTEAGFKKAVSISVQDIFDALLEKKH